MADKKSIEIKIVSDTAPNIGQTINSLTSSASAGAFATKMLDNWTNITQLEEGHKALSTWASESKDRLAAYEIRSGGRPNIDTSIKQISDRIDYHAIQQAAYANAANMFARDTARIPSSYLNRGQTHQQINWSEPRLLPAPPSLMSRSSMNGSRNTFEGDGFTFLDSGGIANDLANANATSPLGILDQTTGYSAAKLSRTIGKGRAIKKRTKLEQVNWEKYGLESYIGNPNMGDGFTTDSFSRKSYTAMFGNKKSGNSSDGGSPLRLDDDRYINIDAKATPIADTILDWINKIFGKASFKFDRMMGKSGFYSLDKNDNPKWREGRGLLGAYSNPKNQSLMYGAMIGAATNTAGSFAGNYGNYLMSRANVTGSFAANYYAGTANENFGNYLGGLVNSRSQFLQGQVRAGVTGAGQLAGAALLPAVGVGGILGKVAAGAGISQLASGLGNMGAAEINQYLQIAGAAYQQKAINSGNASVASGYYGMSRWGGQTSVNVLPKSWTMDGKGVDVPINKFLSNYQSDPYFNQVSAFLQTSNVNPANLNVQDIRNGFTNLRKLGYTDTASASRLGSLSNVYGAMTGNYNGAFNSLVNQLGSGVGAYGNNYNLDTLQNSVRYQNIIGDKNIAQDVAMRSQYFPEVGQAFNTATNSTYAQAVTRRIMWNAMGMHGNLQNIMSGKEKMRPADLDRIQGMEKTGLDKLKGNDIGFATLFGSQFSTLIGLGTSNKLSKVNPKGGLAGASSVGDTAATSTYESVMNTPSMTVNAQQVTIINNTGIEGMAARAVGSVGSLIQTGNPILGGAMQIGSKLIQSWLTTDGSKKN